MSPERQLAILLAHPWTKCKQGDKTYTGAECQVRYAARVNQLAAICDLHRRTPITKELIELNGFVVNGFVDGSDPNKTTCNYALGEYERSFPLYDIEIEKATGIVRFHTFEVHEEAYTEVCELRTVADLENLLDLLGIDKQIKLPQPSAHHG